MMFDGHDFTYVDNNTVIKDSVPIASGSFRAMTAAMKLLTGQCERAHTEDKARALLSSYGIKGTLVRKYSCSCGPGPRVLVTGLYPFPTCFNLEELEAYCKPKGTPSTKREPLIVQVPTALTLVQTQVQLEKKHGI